MFSAASKTDNVSSAANYIEDVFSTYLYTGNGSTQTITNGIDFSGKGGLLWIKNRTNVASHAVVDTARGSSNWIQTNTNNGEASNANIVTGFNSNGFGLGNQAFFANSNGDAYVSWSFRKQAKFVDIVTYTGNGANRTIAHNLGSVPGCIIIKQLSQANDWQVYHRSLANTEYLVLNSTAAKATNTALWNSTTPTSTVFSLGTDTTVNANNATYVAYLFAHDAGGFGTSGTDNVISCGSYTASSNTPQQVTLGYEPQWVLLKRTGAADDWWVFDNMRGMALTSGGNAILRPNTSGAEAASSNWVLPNATGFVAGSSATDTGQYIYIAIRRGPMKTPTSGTSVFSPIAVNAPNSTQQTTNFPVDMQIFRYLGVDSTYAVDRLRGVSTTVTTTNATPYLITNSDGTEGTFQVTNNWNNTGFAIPAGGWGSVNDIFWSFRRAPSFMDVVCYTGNGSSQTVNHNLGVAPELIIFKARNLVDAWFVTTGFGSTTYKYGFLNNNGWGSSTQTYASNLIVSGQPTSTAITFNNTQANYSGYNFVAYLFASCPGVSKVGSYSGTGATQTISCGFAARFVLIKRADGSTGNWWVWDTARGMVAGTDPRVAWDLTAAPSNSNWVYTDASGFQIVTSIADINASGGSYIFLAIA